MLTAVLFGTALSIASTMAVAKSADPAVAATRDSSHFVHDATDPYCSTGGKCDRHHHQHWGWGWGWHHHHNDWGWGGSGWHEHHRNARHHRRHK
jgi:hypothetical protein